MATLDQFYTPDAEAIRSIEVTRTFIQRAGISNPEFIEPSAGGGSFLRYLTEDAVTAIDLEPNEDGIIQADYLLWEAPTGDTSRRIVIGNPPFGKRGRTALAFINKSASIADTVAFILPACFRKYACQKLINSGMSLQYAHDIARQPFTEPQGRQREFSTCFQIWSHHTPNACLRKRKPEPVSHPDFTLRQYNNTPQAEKYFDLPFDFAVLCQGWYKDYDFKATRSDECQRNRQWMMMKAHTAQALQKLLAIDYGSLARHCGTTTPGFRKNDVVAAYAGGLV